TYALQDKPSRRRRKGKKASARRKSGLPSEATLWIGGVGILLAGMLVGLVAGYFLFYRPEPVDDEPLAELDAAAESTSKPGEADGHSPDPTTPEGMILGKWECDLFGKGKATYVWEFSRDGTMTMVAGKRKDSGKYKVVNETTLWMK